MEEFYEKYKYTILITLLITAVVVFGIIIGLIINYYVKPKQFINTALAQIDIGIQSPETHYVPDSTYFDEFSNAYKPIEQFGAEEVFSSDFVNAENSTFEESVMNISDANSALYDLADKYFQVYYGSMRLSPITPLAIANVETPGRADNNVTWSALFPSKYVPINMLYTMDVTTVLSSESIYKPLSTEYSTRDRGALQMSPTYGTNNNYFNRLMSDSEVDKLSAISDTTHENWIKGASSKRGDRFYVPDVCLRLSAAFTEAISDMSKNKYTPNNDYQLLAMCSMYHQQSAVWSSSNHNKSVGKWKSGKLAYEYSELISSVEFLKALKEYAYANPDIYCISNDALLKIYKANSVRPMSDFANSTLVTNYPIKVEYAYIKLCIMYGR